MNTNPTPSTAASEPETLGPADVAHMTGDKPKAKPKPTPFLDPCVDYLRAGPMSPVRLLAQAFKQENATQVQVDSLLREVGRDSRFAMACLDGEVMVCLADQAKPAEPEAPAAQAPADTVAQSAPPAAEVGQPPAEEVKTVGDHLAEAQAAAAPATTATPTLLSQPISPIATRNSEPGVRVKHDVFGEGRIVANGTEVVRVNFDKHGEKEFLWSFIAGKLPLVAATIISRPLTTEEAAAQHLANLEAHHERGKALALRFFELRSEQASLQAEINEVHKELKKHSDLMAEHMRAEPRADGQTTIPFNEPAPAADGQGEPAGEVETKPSESWPYAVAPDQTIPGDSVGLDLLRLRASLRDSLPQGSKPPQVGAATPVEVKGQLYLVVDKSESEGRWFLQPLHTKDEWQQLHEPTYGRAVEEFDQHDEARQIRTAGGANCGRVVKVGAKKFVVGPESQGLVITVDTTPLPEVDLKAKAAGEGKDDSEAEAAADPAAPVEEAATA